MKKLCIGLNVLSLIVCFIAFVELKNYVMLFGITLFAMALASVLTHQPPLFHRTTLFFNWLYILVGLLGSVTVSLSASTTPAQEVALAAGFVGLCFLITPIVNIMVIRVRLKALLG